MRANGMYRTDVPHSEVMLIEFSKAVMFTLCQMRGGSLAILSGFYSSVNTEPDVDWFPDNGNV
jgi:hypothetical protein